MSKGYFVAYLKEGGVGFNVYPHFDRQCTYIQAMDEHSNLVAFMTKEGGQVLAIIPRENILAIERIEMEVEDDE